MNNDNNPTTLRNMENNNPPDIHLYFCVHTLYLCSMIGNFNFFSIFMNGYIYLFNYYHIM